MNGTRSPHDSTDLLRGGKDRSDLQATNSIHSAGCPAVSSVPWDKFINYPGWPRGVSSPICQRSGESTFLISDRSRVRYCIHSWPIRRWLYHDPIICSLNGEVVTGYVLFNPVSHWIVAGQWRLGWVNVWNWFLIQGLKSMIKLQSSNSFECPMRIIYDWPAWAK
jgi:hypothetical protein